MMTMTLMRILAAVAMLGGAAHAGTIAPPAGWTLDPQLSARIGGAPRPGAPVTEAYRPAARGAVLYVTRVERTVAADRRDATAAAELAELRGAVRRQGAGVRVEASTMRANPAAKQLEASLTWRDAAAGVVDASRMLVAADAQRLVAVTGQCVLAADAPAELAKACEAALATLDPGIDAGARVPLSIGGEAEEDEPPLPGPGLAPAAAAGSAAGPAPPAAGAPAAGTRAGLPEPAKLDDGSRVSLQPLPPPKTEPDRRPIYLGFGLLVLALLFWWNRRRRERFEAEDERGDGDRDRDRRPAAATRTEPKAAESPGDDDADDLHAAATGKDPGDKEKDA